jgi:hypothetical protein
VASGALETLSAALDRRVGVSGLVHNERIKLAANFLNTAANGCFVVGIAAPIAGVIYGQLPRLAPVAIGALIWFVVVCVLHTSAQYPLGALRDD